MSLAGLISGADVSRLEHNQFRRILNILLIVEANLRRLPLDALDLSCRDNDPDGGIDARVQWPPGLRHDVLPDGDTILQYKSGKMTPTQMAKEFGKRGVQKALREGASYVLLIGHDYIEPQAKERRQKLKELCRNRKIKPRRCRVFFGSQIARWIALHPSVLIMPELGLGYPAFVTVERWLQNPELQNPWKPEAARTEIIEKIQSFVRREKNFYTLRIEGPAGVGKTRLGLEAVRAFGLAESTIYTPNADETSVTQLLTRIQGDSQTFATVVIDECDAERQDILKSYANLSEGRLRLVCVGPWDVLNVGASSPNLFVITPLSDGTIREVLSESYPTLPKDQIDLAVRLSGGFVKLALFIGDHLSREKNVSPAELAKIHNIKQFLNRFVDQETRNTLQLVSLLWRIGWEDEVQDEAIAVADYFGVSFPDLQRGVKSLRDQGVVVPRGRYLYVSPDLLAINAAADLWDERGPGLIDLVEKLPREMARRQLLRRLASMGHQPQVRQAVERLLGPKGLFKSLTDLDDEFRSEAFSILASTLPDAAITVLERLIEQAPRQDLLDFKVGRRSVIWAIESLLRWPATSLAAARSLRSLALSETESFGNNATAIFSEYFHVFLSRSPISMQERLDLVDELIETQDPTSRMLAAKAAAGALEFHEFRMGENIDRLSGRSFPPEWRPTTLEELGRAREIAIERLKRVAEGQDEAATEARASLVGGVFTLQRDGLFDLAVSVLESVSPQTDTDRRSILDASRRIERDAGNLLTDDQRQRLQALANKTFDVSFSGRLKRWVGPRLHTDFDLEAPDGFAEADKTTRILAEEGYENGISDSEFSWLASPAAENVWEFAYRLGQLDLGGKFIEQIVAVSPDTMNSVLLAGYLNGRANVEGEKFREDFLDALAESRPFLAFACTWRGAGSSRGVGRILKLVDEHKIPADALGCLAFGGWTLALSADVIARLISVMLGANNHAMFDAAAGILMNLLNRRPESLEIVEPLVWALVEKRPERNWSWDWGILATKMADRDPRRVVEIVVSFFGSEHFVPIQSDETMQALQAATNKDPQSAWQIVGDAMLKNDQRSMGLVVSLAKWYGELIPTDMLINWAKENRPRGPRIVASIIAVRQATLPERARALLLSFPRDGRIKSQLVASLQTGVSVGPLSNRVSTDLATVNGWAKDPSPQIRAWAKQLAAGIERRLKRQRKIEEEEEM